MKNILKAGLASMCMLMAVGCSNEELVEQTDLQDDGNFVLEVDLGTESRAYYEEDASGYPIKWNDTDQIYVSSEDGKVYGTLKLSQYTDETKTKAKFKGTLFGSKQKLAYAVYPVPNKSTKKIDLTTRDAEMPNPPMVGTFGDNKNSVHFDATIPAIQLKINNAPAGETLVVTGDGISGTAKVQKGSDGYFDLVYTSDSKNEVTVNNLPGGDVTIYVPVIADGTVNSPASVDMTLAIGDATCAKTVRFADVNVTNVANGNGFLQLTYIPETEENEAQLIEAYDGESVDNSWYDANKTEFTISTPAELVYLAELVNKSEAEGGVNFQGKTIKLGASIDLGGAEWEPIGILNTLSFRGTFDGQGYTISNFTVNAENAAFFGCVWDAEIKDLTLSNATIAGTNRAASLVAYVNGSKETANVPTVINNVIVTDDVKVTLNGEAVDNLIGEMAPDAVVMSGEEAHVTAGTSEALKNVLAYEYEHLHVTLTDDVTYDIAAWAQNPMGTQATETITIDGQETHTLTFEQTDSDWNNVATNGATLILKDLNLTSTRNGGNGAWNNYVLTFNCELEMQNVNASWAICLKKDAKLTDVDITENNEYYALYVSAVNGATVEIDDLNVVANNNGRGIKVIDQYVEEPKLVTLSIENSTFKTAKKAAVLVTNTAGAVINWGEGNDISKVAADKVNAVWVDEDGAKYDYLVTVVGGTKMIEGYAPGVSITATGDYELSTSAAMYWFAGQVNKTENTFAGKTVTLTADIDLNDQDWEPIGQTGATTFNGVFDGQDYTISNLNVDSSSKTGGNYSSGLFGWVESHTAGCGHIKNVNIDGATITGHHNCGALVGYITQGTALVEDCHVNNATITCTKYGENADGDKAGALIGNATVATPVKNCTASNSTISAGRDAGQLIGAARSENVTGCSVTSVTVSSNETGSGTNISNRIIGRLL